jgi:glycosyltransferase involved in cell wall biosynthesis
LRIAVVSPFLDRRHGTERALAEVLERLARDYGCEIHLYAQGVADLVLNDRSIKQSGNPGTIIWHRVARFRAPYVVQFLAWMACNEILRWWHIHSRGMKFDLVLSPGINSLDADVVIVHALFQRLFELLKEEHSRAEARTGFLRRFHRRLYYGLLAALERRIYTDKNVSLATVSQRSADLLKQYFGRQDVPVIPNCVDTKEFSFAERLRRRREARLTRNFRDSELVLLLVGNDWRVKGLPGVLRGMATVPRLPLRVLVVGEDAPAPYQAMAKTLGILERCKWESPRSDVMHLYAAADVYISPSLEDSFGMPVAEAMACGLPVVTSTFAGVSGLIRTGVNGFVLKDPRDSQELQHLLEKLYEDEPFRRQVGEAAAKAAEGWTWDRNAAAVWALLNGLPSR